MRCVSPNLFCLKKFYRTAIEFYKKNSPSDKVWWVSEYSDDGDLSVGPLLISFDKKKIFNLFQDYPHALTKEQKELFDKENPYWKNFFKDRQ